MADNVGYTPGAGATIATDEVTTLNGGAVSAVQVQRVKVTYGADSFATDVSNTTPLPTTGIDTTATGSIAGAGQTVSISLNGQSGVAVQITGTWDGTLQFEGTVDGTTWATVNGVVAGTSTPGVTTIKNGVVRITPSGLAQVRVNATIWNSGTANISMRASAGTGGTFLNQSLTAGQNVIGKVGIDQTTWGQTNAVVDVPALDALASILIELKVISALLQTGLGVRDEVSDLRDDFARVLN